MKTPLNTSHLNWEKLFLFNSEMMDTYSARNLLAMVAVAGAPPHELKLLKIDRFAS